MTPDELRKQAEETFDLSYLDELQLWLAYRVIRKRKAKMLELVHSFLYDRTFFVRIVRALLAWLGVELSRGTIPYFDGAKAYWLGPLLVSFAFMLGAGDRTPENVKELSERMPETLPEGRITVVPKAQGMEGGTPVDPPTHPTGM